MYKMYGDKIVQCNSQLTVRTKSTTIFIKLSQNNLVYFTWFWSQLCTIVCLHIYIWAINTESSRIKITISSAVCGYYFTKLKPMN